MKAITRASSSFLILLLLILVLGGAVSFKPKSTVTSKRYTSHIKIDDCNKSLLKPRGGGQPTTTMEKLPLPKGTYSTGKILEIHKGTWLPVALAFMYRFNNYNYRSCLMASLFGGY